MTAKEHFYRLKQSFIELQKLRSELKAFFEGNSLSSKEAIPEGGVSVLSLPQVTVDVKVGAHDRFLKRFCCDSLSDIVALDLRFLQASKNSIKFCALCGRRFLAISARQRFCQRKNERYYGRTCAEAGPAELYKASVENDLVRKGFQRNYRTYHAWKSKAIKAVKISNLGIEETKKIIYEIDTGFNSWCATGEKILACWLNGQTGEQEALSGLKLPSTWE